MKPWHHGLPETRQFVLFPPAGQVEAYGANKERTIQRLKLLLPDLTFEIADISLDVCPAIIPICGEAGEGGRGMFASPPPNERQREIERKLAAVDIAALMAATIGLG